jgi:hypothetical protein
MSEHRYFRYTLKGEIGPHEAVEALGAEAAEGMIVRVDSRGGQTHIYLAAFKAPTSKLAAAQIAEVSERDVTDLSKA